MKLLKGEGDKKYCESNLDIIYYDYYNNFKKWEVGNPNRCWEPPMGGWELKGSLPFWGTQLRGYAVTHMLLYK